jgi:acyl-coenzyme A synthetase/AMP-(fatty) acid ligase
MLPLLGFADHPSTLVWHGGRPISRAAFCYAAVASAAALPLASHAINLATGRLAFMTGLAAAALRGQTTLLPPNQTTEGLDALRRAYPEHHVINDEILRGLSFDQEAAVPEISAELEIATLFTSGSTGSPQPQTKTWRALALNGSLDAQRFLQRPAPNAQGPGNALSIVATVPSQHMFGLQTTVLLPWAGNCAIVDARPFFPADIRLALESVPEPRALVSTPMHLRTCLSGERSLPALEFVLSATAPMPLDLAYAIETQWSTQVLEIYGSTEAGTIGTRRTIRGDAWQLPPGATLEIGERALYRAAHLSQPLVLNDRLEHVEPHGFRLLGRAAEQIKIAGKRATLAELTQALLAVPGVLDGVLFQPAEDSRTAALVVAPHIERAYILDELAKRIDAAFLPRPLVLVSALPRNEMGKLPREALLAALRTDRDL